MPDYIRQIVLAVTSDRLTADVSTDLTTPQVLYSMPFTKRFADSALLVKSSVSFLYLNGGAVVAENAARITLQVDGVNQGGNAFLVPLIGALESGPAWSFTVVRRITGIAAGARVARIRWYLVIAPPAGDVIFCAGTNLETAICSIEVMEVLG